MKLEIYLILPDRPFVPKFLTRRGTWETAATDPLIFANPTVASKCLAEWRRRYPKAGTMKVRRWGA